MLITRHSPFQLSKEHIHLTPQKGNRYVLPEATRIPWFSLNLAGSPWYHVSCGSRSGYRSNLLSVAVSNMLGSCVSTRFRKYCEELVIVLVILLIIGTSNISTSTMNDREYRDTSRGVLTYGSCVLFSAPSAGSSLHPA